MSSSGLTTKAAKIISASGTVRCLDGRNPRYDIVVRYRTAADVRAISNLQWAEWLRAGTVPFNEFSSEHGCQMVLRNLLTAHGRRLGLKVPRKKRPPTNSEVSAKVAEAYWRHVAAVQAERCKGLDD